MKKFFLKLILVFIAMIMPSFYSFVTKNDFVFDVEASADYVGGIVWTDISMGGNVKWKYNPQNDTVTVFGSGNMKDFDSGNDGQYWDALWGGSTEYPIKHAKKIVIESGVTNIGNNAFVGFKELREVVIPESVRSIGSSAFKNNAKLTKITLPSGVRVLSNEIFSGCSSLSSVNINNGISLIGANAFRNCVSLPSSLHIPATVKTIGDSAFRGCKKISTLFLKEGLETISANAFVDTKITSVDMPYSVKSVGNNAFGAVTINCCYDDAAYTYCQNHSDATAVVRAPEFKAVVVPSTVPGQVVATFYVKNASRFNAANFEISYNSDVTPVLSDSFVETVSSFYAIEVCENNKILIAIALAEEISYENCIDECEYKIAEVTFNYPQEAHSVEFKYSSTIFMNNNEKVYPEAIIAEYGEHIFVQSGTPVPANCTEYGYTTEICTICNAKRQVNIMDAYGHDYENFVKPVSCEEYGFTKYTCLRCNDVYTDDVIIAPGHNFVELIDNGTCIKKSAKLLVCSVCGISSVIEEYEINPDIHENTEVRNYFPDNCENNGYTGDVYCIDCNKKISEGDIIPSTGKHDYISVITTPATCCSKGIKIHNCSVCNDTYTETLEIDSNNHSGETEIRNSVTPHCGNNGYSGDEYCLGCNLMIKEGSEIPATENHSYTSIITTPATCEATGVRTYNCSICKDVYTEPVEINSKNHSGGTEIRNAVAENCGSGGYSGDTYCLGCNSMIKEGSEIPATENHSYTSVITTPATCKSTGIKTYTCLICKDSYTESVEINSKNHSGETEIRGKIMPDCKNAGFSGNTYCLGCNAKIADGSLIPATENHRYTSTITTPATCEATGVRAYNCSICKDVYTEPVEINSKNHSGETEIRNAVEEDCGNDGYSGDKYCLGCNTIIEEGSVISATGNHSYTSVITTPATCKSTGIRTHTCSICNDSYAESVEINSKNHSGETEIRGKIMPDCKNAGFSGNIYCLSCNAKIADGSLIPSTDNHSYVSSVTKPATCNTIGLRIYVCNICDDSYTEPVAKDKNNHIGEKELHNKKDATCISEGYTGDVYCKDCNTVYLKGEKTEKLSHIEVIIKGKPATCTETGLTEGKKCSVCGKITVVQKTVPALGHTYTTAITAPTCTEKGFAIYTCLCGDTFNESFVAALGHTEELIAGNSATCTETGLTDGKKCSVCGEILVHREVIPELPHTPGEWEVVTPAQVGAEGREHQKCVVCDTVINNRTIPAIPVPTHKTGDANGDGKITAADARITLRISAKLEKIEDYNLPLAVFDATGDGKLTAADARKILRASAKLETL